jgi:hypothetical protein
MTVLVPLVSTNFPIRPRGLHIASRRPLEMTVCTCCAESSGSPRGAVKSNPSAGPRQASAPSALLAEDDENRCRVLTLGHSTRPIDAFTELLRGHGVTQLIDVRTVPRSRHNPQFNQDALPASLAAVGIGYAHAAGLGGFRPTTPDSLNPGWRNLSFRGYADYMQTPDFAENLRSLMELSLSDRVALMCAEAVPWRCHRSLIADALVVHGIPTCEIVSPTRLQAHKLTPFARVSGLEITYPAEE